MKYKFVNEKTNEASLGSLPVLKKENAPFTLPAAVAKAYLASGVIEPVGKKDADDAIEEIEVQMREEPVHVYTETELKKEKKAELVIIAGSLGVSVVPDAETNEKIITKILAAQEGK